MSTMAIKSAVTMDHVKSGKKADFVSRFKKYMEDNVAYFAAGSAMMTGNGYAADTDTGPAPPAGGPPGSWPAGRKCPGSGRCGPAPGLRSSLSAPAAGRGTGRCRR